MVRSRSSSVSTLASFAAHHDALLSKESRHLTLWQWCTSPGLRFVSWLALMRKTFGIRFLVFIVIGEHLFRGFLEGSGSIGGGFLVLENLAYVHMKVGASTKSILMAVSGATWSLKPIYGMISDTFVIGRSRRAPWIVITAVLGTTGAASIFSFGPALGPVLTCVCFFAIHMQISWTDLMIEAAYTEKMQADAEHGADIVTWVWGGISVAAILGVLIVGGGLQYYDPFTVMGCAIPIVGATVLPGCLGWLGDHGEQKPKLGIDWHILKQQRHLFLCTIVLSLVVIASCVGAILRVSLFMQAVVASVGAAIVVFAGATILPPGLWKPMVFLFISATLTIDTYGFLDNFYLDAATPEEAARTGFPVCTDCPNFSSAFYVTTVGIFDAIFALIGLWLFNDGMPDWTYRKAMFLTQIAVSLATLLDIVQFERWNISYLGIPDTVFMILRHAVQNVCSTIHFMPTTILISKLCPEGVESTVFSLLAGFSNFGMTISSFLGAYALEWMGLADIGKGEVDVFQNTWMACVVQACVPLLSLALLPFLIPDARMSDLLALRTLVSYETPLAEDSAWPESIASDDEDAKVHVDGHINDTTVHPNEHPDPPNGRSLSTDEAEIPLLHT